jgi:hypothetical protein
MTCIRTRLWDEEGVEVPLRGTLRFVWSHGSQECTLSSCGGGVVVVVIVVIGGGGWGKGEAEGLCARPFDTSRMTHTTREPPNY